MIKRIIPLTFFALSCLFVVAQTPTKVVTGDYNPQPNSFTSAVCPPGANPDAGISTQTLFSSAESNNVLYLCMGDSMDIMHFGGDLSGDPQPASEPGFSYVFYSCPPTISGPNWATILTDPCHIDPPNVTSVQQGVDIDGNATFFNNGQVQTIFNSGDPIQVWFAPMTFDDFASFGPEQDPNTLELGPCMDVNVNDAFSVTYLNAIQGSNINLNANGDCTASFIVSGGLPEFDGSNYTNVMVTLSTDPSIEADVDGATFTHGETIEFTVPVPGVYDVLIEDGVSCSASFTIDMSACTTVSFTASEEFTNSGDVVCVEISVDDFVDILNFQFTVEWDPAVLQYNSVNSTGVLSDLFFGPAAPTDALTVSWLDITFSGVTIPDGSIIFEICFDVIGAPGTESPIDFSSSLTEIEVFNSSQEELGVLTNDGIVIVAGDFTVNFTSCSTLTGDDNGTFTLTVNGGIPPFNYSWENIPNTSINGNGTILNIGGSDTVGDGNPPGDDGLAPGTYSVTVTDNNGDIQIANVEVFDAPELLVFINGMPPTCAGSTDGFMEITSLPLGGVPPHNIIWSTLETGVTQINNLAQGVYSVTVTDAAGCSQFAQNGLQVGAIEVDTVSLMHVSCFGGGNDGAAEVVASGGVINPGSDYVYEWTTGDMGPSISNMLPGAYCVSITDDNGCEVVHCLEIFPPDPPTIVSWDSISVDCPNDTNGELTVNALPGNSPIDSYTWSPPFPGAGSTITGLGPGTYYVTVTAEDGCMVTDSATLYAPLPLNADSTQTVPPNCPGDNNGTVAIFVSGGVQPYTYTWSTGASGAFPLLPGLVGDSTYTVTVTDSGNCGEELIVDIYLQDPPAINVVFANLADVSCDNGIPCDGQATAMASGGTAGTGFYNFNWISGESDLNVTASSATQLCQGFQTIEVNDGECSVTDSVEIGAPPPLGVDIANTFSTPASCFGLSDGEATVQATGGVGGYDYQWLSPNVNGPTITGVPADTFFVMITDANGCTFPFTIEVGEPDSLVASINPSNTSDVSCNGDTDGQIEVTWSGGNAGSATYTWTNNVSTSSVATGLSVGSYTVTVTDQNGCSDEASYTVSQPPPITFVIAPISEPLCNGYQTFVAIDTAYGGSGGNDLQFFFSVDGGPRQPIIGTIPILAGDHYVTVFDINGCTSEQNISVDEPSPLIVNLGPDIEIELGDSTLLDPIIGSELQIDSIIWDPTERLRCNVSDCSEVWVSPFNDIVYTLTVVDTNGCVGSDDIFIQVDKNRNVFIPNIFTPNGDGTNDVFRVHAGVGVERIKSFQVFSRWGETVFEARDLIPNDIGDDGWDGTFKGDFMNPGVFVYLIEVEFTDGLILLYRGDITLLH